MADVRQRTTLGNRFRFLLRVLGLTAIVAVVVGLLLLNPLFTSESIRTFANLATGICDFAHSVVHTAIGGHADQTLHIAAIVSLAGLGVIAFWLLIELGGGLFQSSGRKSVAGSVNALQVALIVALVVIVNAVAFGTHKKWDLTREQDFTLTPALVNELERLRTESPTTIVVLHLHTTADSVLSKRNPFSKSYGKKAELKVIEKVDDLVAQLADLGPRFNVIVLDAEDDRFERDMKQLTKTRPGLEAAINNASEDSIFFYADGKVQKRPRTEADRLATGGAAVLPDPTDGAQSFVYSGPISRMSFAEFYQLDMTSSREPTESERQLVAAVGGGLVNAPGIRGRGNLVLIPRGKESFVQKVIKLEERKPKVGLAVIHPYLSSRETFDEYSAAGLRSTLEAHGFSVVDIILKRWGRGGPPTPAAYTYEESELDRIENRYNFLNLVIAARELESSQFQQLLPRIDKAPLAELSKLFGRQLGRPIRTEEDRAFLRQIFQQNIQFRQDDIAELNKQLAEVLPLYRESLSNERASENRRITDVKAKMKQYVADCDVLIVPRLTVIDIAKSEIIGPSLFNLTKDQSEVVREFVKAGKPVLFSMGPTNVGRTLGPDSGGDEVEALLPRLGIELGRQTILTDKEGQAIAERRDEALGTTVDVPPLLFDLAPSEGRTVNPVTAAFRTSARAVDRTLDIKKSGYRPIYVAPGFFEDPKRWPYAGEIMFTGRDSWNEDRPLPEEDYLPKFDPAKPDDPKRGTRDEERRGPFPVGVALEVPVPAEWTRDDGFADQQKIAALLPILDGGLDAALLTVAARESARPKVRIAAFGHGGLFTGKSLDPAAATLLLHTLNWQLHREDRLPQSEPVKKWDYPRVELSEQEFALWRWGTFLGLPLLCGYLGSIVLMARKVR